MSLKTEFVREIQDRLDERIDEAGERPTIENWPDEDDFAKWIAYHSPHERPVICATPEFKDTPFCGPGYH